MMSAVKSTTLYRMYVKNKPGGLNEIRDEKDWVSYKIVIRFLTFPILSYNN